MKRFLKLLACILTACFMLAAFAACTDGNDPSDGDTSGVEDELPDGGEEQPPVSGGEEEGLTLADFNLAESLANINIVTDGGVDIEGEFRNQPYYGCSVTLTGGRDGENFEAKTGKVRVRGNNTANYDKKSFRLKFDKKINLLGLNGGREYKNWVLLACYKDVTFLRDAVVFELAKQTLAENGLYASEYAYAEVSVNGVYNGLYMVAEQQQVNTSRVDINEPAEGYEGTDIGYFVEYDGNAIATEERGSYFSLSYKNFPLICENGDEIMPSQWRGNESVYYTVKNDMYGADITNTAQLRFIKAYVENVFKIMYDAIYNGVYTTFNEDYTQIIPAAFTDARSTVEAVCDIPSLVDSFILQEIACDNDVDFSSFFFTVDMSATGNKKLTFQAPWDFDSGFGMMAGLEELDQIFTANVSTNAAQGLNPWLALPAHAEWFMEEVAARWNELYERGVFERVVTLIEVVTEGYEEYFTRNYEKWDNLGKIVDEVQGETVETFTTHAEAASYLKNWLRHRIEFLDGYFNR